MIKGYEFHDIIRRVFDDDVKNLQKSEQIQVNCPKCQERDGLREADGKYNLEINTNKRIFKCWKCDNPSFSGPLGKLIRLYGSKIDYEVYKDYASNYNDYEDEMKQDIIYNISLPNEMIMFSNMDVTNPEHLEPYKYLVIERRIPREIILKYKLGFCISGKYSGRIIIPSYDKYGDVNYFVGRAYRKGIKPPYLNPDADKNQIIFNEGYINWDSIVFLVEGSFEFLSFPVNTIILLGKTIGEKLFNTLAEKKPHVVVILDPDAYKSNVEICQKLKTLYVEDEHKIRIVKLNGKNDLDEINRFYGKEEVMKNLKTARHLVVDDYFI